MPFTTVNDPRYSDVVLKEQNDYDSRRVVTANITTSTGTYKQGTVLFRAKAVDDSAAWDVVDAGADLSISNEYAVLIGDSKKPVESLTLTNGTPASVIVLAKDASVKEEVLKAIHQTGGFTANNFRDLKGLLFKNSGILVKDSLVAL
jgi:hypothetical protein